MVLVHSFILASYSDAFHEIYFPDFYCNDNTDINKKNELLTFTQKESLSVLQILNWMYTGKLFLHNETLYERVQVLSSSILHLGFAVSMFNLTMIGTLLKADNEIIEEASDSVISKQMQKA